MKKSRFLAGFLLGLILIIQSLLIVQVNRDISMSTRNDSISNPKMAALIIEDPNEFLEGTMENLTIYNNGYLMLEGKFPYQPNWINMTSSTKPTARRQHSMAYDSTHDKVILFGGWDGAVNDETWAYDFETNMWTNMTMIPSTKPSARYRHAMVYDSTHDKVILFGGYDGANRKDDTWTYDLETNTWTNMTKIPSTKPSARYMPSMVYDSTHDKVILFGGWDGDEDDETWAYDFETNTWTNMTMIPSTKPSIRKGHSMAYDSTHDKVILFGGDDGGLNNDETWTYDLETNTWTNKNPPTKPTARRQHSMAFDSTHDKVILFGGINGGLDDETWTYDLEINTWTNMTITPPNKPTARYSHSMVYDSTHDKEILFGGDDGDEDDETWVFRLFDYHQTGRFDSKITDLDGIYKFSSEISWSPENQTIGTNLTVQIGFSNTINDYDFTYTSPDNSSFTFAGNARYIRYRVNFESTDNFAFSPILENVMIIYTTDIVYSNIQNINSVDESEGDTIINEDYLLEMILISCLVGVTSVFALITIIYKKKINLLEKSTKLKSNELKSKR